MPKRGTPEYFAMGLLDQILVEGEDSMLYQELVKNKNYTSGINGGINYLGNMFNYNGPMLFAGRPDSRRKIHAAGNSCIGRHA